jgi:hypothetical protein
MTSLRAYTPQDVKIAVEFVSPYKNKIWEIKPDGRVRFSLNNGDRAELDKVLSRPLTYKEDWDQLKKQIKRYLAESSTKIVA